VHRKDGGMAVTGTSMEITPVLVDAAGGLRVPDLVETRAVPMLKII